MALEVMPVKTVILGPRPPEVEALIARRRLLGLDRMDEVWEGVYHVAPYAHGRHGFLDQSLAVLFGRLAADRGLVAMGPVNLGHKHDYRVPDRVLLREAGLHLYYDTVALVVEILSPDDETFEKFAFYARHGVEEILVADADTRGVRLWRLVDGEYRETDTSELLGLSAQDLAAQLDWPPEPD